jgi:hypothetical protein
MWDVAIADRPSGCVFGIRLGLLRLNSFFLHVYSMPSSPLRSRRRVSKTSGWLIK